MTQDNNTHQQNNTPTGTYSAITAGTIHTCALRTDETVTCWGAPSQVQTPNGVQWNGLPRVFRDRHS